MARLILVRHGETQWNRDSRCQGHSDVELSELGRQQAERLRERLARVKLDAIYSSDLERAWETAATIARGRSPTPTAHRQLREASLGEWEGLDYTEIIGRYPELWRQRRDDPAGVAPPGGETRAQLLARVRPFVEAIAQQHSEGTVLIVSHGGPISTLVCHFLGLPLRRVWQLPVHNGSLSIVDLYPEGAIVSLLNDTCHLGELAGNESQVS